jgi:serine/threonine-protein kinase
MSAGHHPHVETVHVPDGPLPPSTDESRPATGDAGAAGAADGSGLRGGLTPNLPKFGRFQALAELGAGAMGTVYRAHDDVLGRDVAIKALTADGELGVRERFLREARAISAVQHPNILAIYDAGTEGTTPYLVMELASDGTLRDRIKRAALDVVIAREAGIQIARALAAAHAANIIHRDVKPANILATKNAAGEPIWKLADFGIARTADSTLTLTGQFIGSPSYAAPESLRAGQYSAASDVYGLAATLYEALSGAPPHGSHDMQSVIRKLEEEPPPLASKVAVPGPLGDAITRALAKDPAARPTAEQFARMLAGDESSPRLAPPAPRSAPSRSAPPRATPPPRLKWIAGALAAVAIAVLAYALSNRSSSPSPLPAALRHEEATPTEQPSTDEPQPMVVDENGVPYDDETARQILEQMKRDADEEMRHGKGHGKKKKKHDDFWSP